MDIYTLDAACGVSPHDILSAIEDVERGEPATGVNPATQFKNLPLKGLWHKHYFSANFVVKNVLLGLGESGVEKLVEPVITQAQSPVITEEMIRKFANR